MLEIRDSKRFNRGGNFKRDGKILMETKYSMNATISKHKETMNIIWNTPHNKRCNLVIYQAIVKNQGFLYSLFKSII